MSHFLVHIVYLGPVLDLDIFSVQKKDWFHQDICDKVLHIRGSVVLHGLSLRQPLQIGI